MSMFSQPIAQAGQTFLSAYATKEQGKAGIEAAKRRAILKENEAVQAEQNAGQAIAAAQRVRDEQTRQATLVASRAQAVAAASGGGASDATVVNLISRIKGEGAYRGMVAVYQGEEQARKLRLVASTKRYEGAVGLDTAYREQKLGNTMATYNMVLGAGSLASKYGGSGFGGTANDTGLAGGTNEYAGDSGFSGGDTALA